MNGINWLIAIAGLTLGVLSCRAWLVDRRRRRERESVRHVVGAYQWWGKR